MTYGKLIPVFCLLACFVPYAAGTTTATMDLTGVNNGANMGGVYTSPYFATITTGKTSISTAVICDDFSDDSYIGETWTADVTSLASLTSTNSTVKWNGTTWNGTQLSQAQEYMAAAVLTEDLLPIYSTNPTAAGEYGYAIWALLDPSASPLSYLTSSEATATTADINSAVAEVTGAHPTVTLASFGNVQIYSYDAAASAAVGQPTGCGGTCPPPPQEFLVVGMPEPPMAVSLLFYLLSAGAVAFVFRKRIVKRIS